MATVEAARGESTAFGQLYEPIKAGKVNSKCFVLRDDSLARKVPASNSIKRLSSIDHSSPQES